MAQARITLVCSITTIIVDVYISMSGYCHGRFSTPAIFSCSVMMIICFVLQSEACPLDVLHHPSILYTPGRY